jgi:hypothetical protein
LLLIWVEIVASHEDHSRFHWHDKGQRSGTPQSHSCIHDKILEQQRRIGVKQYKITPQVSFAQCIWIYACITINEIPVIIKLDLVTW